MEIEHTLTGLRLLRSYFNEEQLQTPVLQFFKENLPNLSVVRNEENGQLDVQWKDNDGNLSTDNADGRDLHASLLRRMSLTYPYCSALQSFSGYELSSKAGNIESIVFSMCSTELGIFFITVIDILLPYSWQ